MYIFLSILIVITALLIVLIVVIQNSKGGGLAAGFASANQVMGVRKTTDSLEKFTWWLAGILVFLCVTTTVLSRSKSTVEDSLIKDDIIETTQQPDVNTLPPFNQVPAEPQAPAQEPVATPAE